MTNHTPGPWSLETWPPRENDEYQRPRLVIIADGSYLVDIEDGLVREIHDGQMANARLIAAAPDLLAALQYIVSWTPIDRDRWTGDDWNGEIARDMANEAIRKATE